MIPQEALEAAVKASYRRNDWGDEYSRKFIERALEAAAPFLRAQALEDAAEWQTELLGNPYFNSAQRDRLLWRAATERGQG